MLIDDQTPIRHAVDGIEACLAHGTERPAAQFRDHLVSIAEWLARHRAVTEAHDGTIAEVEVVLGHMEEVEAALRDHDALTALVRVLGATLDDAPAAPLSASQQRRGAHLAEAIRHHLSIDIDLVQMRYTLDIGVAD